MRVLVTDRLAQEGIARLKSAELEVIESSPTEPVGALISGFEALIVRNQTVDAELLEKATKLLIVGRAGVGCDNIDVETCSRLRIAVVNTPGASAITTAERTIAMMLALLHRIGVADRSLRSGKWERRAFLATEAYGKTLGVLGFGNIGRVVADRARALQMNVVVHDPFVPPAAPFNLGHRPVAFDELFDTSDVVTCHVSADPKLTGLVGAKQIARMRQGACLLNLSRGFVVDEKALVDALTSGHLMGAALDVFEEEPLPPHSVLRTLDNVVISPHLGASSVEGERRVAISIAEQVVRFLRDGTSLNFVASPSTFRHDKARDPRAGEPM
jgi:D-3-phosphoglycerate dehydrogenase